MRNDQNWNCFFHNLEAAFFLATLVLKKEQEGQEEDREKETLKKIKKVGFFAIFGNAMPGTWSRDHLFPLFLLLICISLFQAFTMQNEA